MYNKHLYFSWKKNDTRYRRLKTYLFTTYFYRHDIAEISIYLSIYAGIFYTLALYSMKLLHCKYTDLYLARNQSLSDLSSFDVVAWLYSPCAIRCRARVFFAPVAFLIFALLFWNQILIWDSLRPSSWAKACRLCSVKYRFVWNSVFSLWSCSAVKAVLGRLSSLLAVFFFGFRDLGPVFKNIYIISQNQS